MSTKMTVEVGIHISQLVTGTPPIELAHSSLGPQQYTSKQKSKRARLCSRSYMRQAGICQNIYIRCLSFIFISKSSNISHLCLLKITFYSNSYLFFLFFFFLQCLHTYSVYLDIYVSLLEDEEHNYFPFLLLCKWIDSPLFPEMIEAKISEGEFGIDIILPLHLLCSCHFSA